MKKLTPKISPTNLSIYLQAARLSIASRLRLKRPLLPKPEVILGLTLACNIRCAFCLAHSPLIADEEERASNVTWQTGRSMSRDDLNLRFETFKRIVDDLEYLDPYLINLSDNGEILRYPYLSEALDYLRSRQKIKNKALTLITNGALMDERIARKLLEHNVNQVSFSVNASNAATYATMHFVNAKVFDQVVTNIKNFVAMVRNHPRKPTLNISFVLCKKNYREVTDMIRFTDALGIKWTKFTMMYYCKGRTTHLKDYTLDAEDKKELRHIIFDALVEAKQRHIYNNLNSLLNILQAGSKDCFRPSPKDAYHLQVHANGAVNPYDFPYYMGNVYERSILDIWYSPQYTRFRNMIKEKSLTREHMPNRPYCFRCHLKEGETDCCRIVF
jgi:MoaA/NifB/PqqE/SkfB family radical SAM enzyme